MTTCPYHLALRKVSDQQIAAAGGGGGIDPAQLNAAIAAQLAAQLPIAVSAAVQAQLAADLGPAVQAAVGTAVPPAVVAEVTAQLAATLAPAVTAEVASQLGPEVTAQLNAQLPPAVVAEVANYLSANLPALLTAEVASQLPAELQLLLAAQLPPEVANQLPAVVAAQLPAELATQLPAALATQVAAVLPAEVASQLPPLVATQVAGLLPAEVTAQLVTALPPQVATQVATQLPAELTAQLATALPPAVTAEVLAQLPGAVAANLAGELAAQLPAALTTELAAQLPAVLAAQLTTALPPEVATQVAAQLPVEVASQLPPLVTTEVATQLAAALPSAVATEVAAQLPAEVSSAVAAQLPGAVTAEIASQLPAAVTSEVASQLAAQLPAAVDTAVATQLAAALDALCFPVVIRQLSDFPAPSGGVITLDSTKTYRICGQVNIGANTLQADNISIVGDNTDSSALLGSRLQGVIRTTGLGTKCFVKDLRVFQSAGGGPAIEANCSGVADTEVRVENCVLGGPNSHGLKVLNTELLHVTDSTFPARIGLDLQGAVENMLLDGNVFEQNSLGGICIPVRVINSSSTGNGVISNSIFRPTTPFAALNWPSGSTITGTIAINGNVFVGPAAPSSGTALYPTSEFFLFSGNVGVVDSKRYGRIHFAENLALTNLDDTPAPIGFNSTGHLPFTLDVDSQGFDLDGATITTQGLRCLARQVGTYRIVAHLGMEKTSGGLDFFSVSLLKNGTDIPDAQRTAELSRLQQVISLSTVVSLGLNDKVTITLQNDDFEPVRVRSAELVAYRID